MTNIPVKIYLQAGELEDDADFNIIASDGSVTWCAEKIQESDTPYIKESAVMEVFAWLLGYVGDFPARLPGDGQYHWRKDLRKKIVQAGLQFVEPEK